MDKEQCSNDRLPRNFHKTFKPERHYINAMLRFAASGRSGDFQEIASSTGIPMGASSGKVPAILDYCRGMGLITLASGSERSSIKIPELTSLGRIILLEDPFLKSQLSQWLSHLNLCSPRTGADVWYQVFFPGVQTLGQQFERSQLESHLKMIYRSTSNKVIGPIVGMYEDEAAFKVCGALFESNGLISKKSAPVLDEMGRGYGAWMLQLISDYFPNQQQVAVTDLDKKAGWKTISGWSISSVLTLLELLEKKKIITVDRHMDPWLVQPTMNVEDAWRNVFADMI